MTNLPIHEPLDFSTVMRRMQTTDTDHADNWNVLYERLLNNDVFLKAFAESLAGAGRTTETIKGNADLIALLNETVSELKEYLNYMPVNGGNFDGNEPLGPTIDGGTY